MLLAACGGGGGGGGTDEPFLNDGFGPGRPSTCPTAAVAEVWLNNRLGCLVAGQPFVNYGKQSTTGTKADRAYLLNQTAYDSSRSASNLLAGNAARHYKYFLCIRNAPESLASVYVASDLDVAIGFGGVLRRQYLPPGVGGSTTTIGGVTDSIVQASCNPALHPVIVDFDTGKIESVNSAALTNLQVYDL